MMQALLPKWKSSYFFKKIVVQSSTTALGIPHFAYFHSTAPISDNWKSKQNNSDKRGCEPPTKDHIRFITRQRRADAKKALKDMLFRDGVSKFSSEPLPRMKDRRGEKEADLIGKKSRSKAFARREKTRAKNAKSELKHRRKEFFEQFDENPNVSHATYGNKWYTYASRSSKDPRSQSSTTGFEWRENSRWSSRMLNESDIEGESDGESCFVDTDSDRLVLGLPARSTLKIDDVKNAFRVAALKWHPDRHQGPTQASAAEKFKRCVDAYKSLCHALSTA